MAADRRAVAVLAAAAAVLLAGIAAGGARLRPPPLARVADHSRGLSGPWHVRAVVEDDSRALGPGATFRLDVREVRVDGVWRAWPGTVRIEMAEPPSGPHVPLPGARLEAFLSLRPQRAPANPGRWDRHRSLVAGTPLRARLKSYRQLRRRGEPSPWSVAARMARLRGSLREGIEGLFPRRHPEVTALVLGERGRVDPALSASLARSGLAHLLAISGLHVGIVLGFVYGLARVGGLSRPAACTWGLAAVGAVVLVVAPAAPVRRAAVMAGAALLGHARGRHGDGWSGLALALLGLAAVEPAVVRDPGFLLSAAATTSILGLAPRIRAALGRMPGASALSVTLAAQLGVLPVLVPLTHRITGAALLLNLVAVPLLVAALCGIGATGLAALAGWSPGATAAARATEAAIDLVGLLAERGGALAWARPSLPAAAARGRQPDAARLVVLDVGQGDAIALLPSSGESLLVDAGGYPGIDYDTGSALVAPALRALGVGRLEAVAVSHPHADHAGGVPGILAELPVGALWLGSVEPTRPDVTRLLDAAAARAVPVVSLAAGARRRLGECDLRVIHPRGRWLVPGGAPTSNDASLALAARCGHRAVLLPGDAEGPAERSWSSSGAVEGLAPAPVLKAPHHGSATSSSDLLLDALGSRHAVISAGWNNRFGLPRAEVLQRYRERGMAVYRTDRDGAVIVELGRRIRVRGTRWTSGNGDPVLRHVPR